MMRLFGPVVYLSKRRFQELANAPRIKLVVVGDGAVGKTWYDLH